MTVPDKLIQAAADGSGIVPSDFWHNKLERALAAAFAALPECEEAVDVVATALVAAWNKQTYVGQTAQKDAETAIAALARMAQP